jgi:hypothetical protein
MRKRVAVIAAVVGLLLLAGAGGVYAYDHSNAEEIGKGVRVGGVDVSGLTPEQARAKLRSAVLEPLSRPVVVRALGKRHTLTPKRAKVAVDIDGSVDAAMQRTRDGNMLSRTWRDVRGEPVDAELELDISYSKRAIKRLVKRVQKEVDKPAVDASVDLESGDVTPRPSAEGRRLLARKLKRQVRKRLLDVGDAKTVKARTDVVKPKVTRGQVSGDPHRRPRQLQADALQGAQAGQDVRHRGRSGRARDAGRALPHPEQGGRPCLERPGLGLGRRSGRPGDPGRRSGEPAQGALAGNLRRGGDPRDRCRLLDRDGRIARLHPHADPRGDRAL